MESTHNFSHLFHVAEINALLDQAHTDRDELRDAVSQQVKYEAELQALSSSMNEANAKLIGSPIRASSVDDLKKQVYERNVSFYMLAWNLHA